MDQQDDIPRPAPVAWTEALERSRADLAAGRSIPLAPFLAHMDERIAQAEARKIVKATADTKA